MEDFTIIILSLLPLGLGFLHHWAAEWETVIWISAAIMTFFAWLTFTTYKKETWESIEMAD